MTQFKVLLQIMVGLGRIQKWSWQNLRYYSKSWLDYDVYGSGHDTI